jgi:cytochrome c
VSWYRSGLFGSALVLLASLALARFHPFGDAGLYVANPAETHLLNTSDVPPELLAILIEKCADCHSNHTNAPFYGHFAPVSWLMERDIVKAREAMNLSMWGTYSEEQQQTLAAKMVQQTRSNDMPPLQYRIIHWNARITDADLKAFGQWARGAQPAVSDALATGNGDPSQGKILFEKRCTGCHSLTQNKEGPRLQGVYGRTSGTAPDFAYSVALKKAQIVWGEKSLDKWLTDTDAFVPGNDMDFLVSSPQERRDIISYLKQTSSK